MSEKRKQVEFFGIEVEIVLNSDIPAGCIVLVRGDDLVFLHTRTGCSVTLRKTQFSDFQRALKIAYGTDPDQKPIPMAGCAPTGSSGAGF